MTAPSAASTVNAATVIASRGDDIGYAGQPPDQECQRCQDHQPEGHQDAEKQRWRIAVLPGHGAREHHGRGEYSAKSQDQFGQLELAPHHPEHHDHEHHGTGQAECEIADWRGVGERGDRGELGVDAVDGEVRVVDRERRTVNSHR